MTDTPPSPPQEELAADPDALPRHTTPTWEVELLISGVAVFAMLQLPGWLDDRYFDLQPRLDANWAGLLQMGYLYAKLGALILASTFVLHLLLRSHWIALVGMGSVYPRGIIWERLRMGKQRRLFEQAHIGDIPAVIERADNRATIVFAAGVYLAFQMLKLVVLISVGAAASWVIGLYTTFQPGPTLVWWLIAALFVPMVIAGRIDRRVDERIRPDGTAARALRAVFAGYARIGIGHSTNPGMLVMLSNEGYRRVVLLFAIIVTIAISTTLYQLRQHTDPGRFGSYALLPHGASDAPDMLDAAHYDDQRGSERLGTAPFLPSQIVADSWMRLTIPFRPALHNPALLRSCPALAHAMEVATDSTASTQQRHDLIACLGAMHPLSLDAHALSGVRYDLGIDVKAQRPALIAMIDVRALANGRHELLIGEPAGPDRKPTPADLIAFWR